MVVFGVSGSGKSTVARALADRLGCDLGDGDDLHTPADIAKMSAGIPLTDADRAPWLRRVRVWIDERVDAGRDAVIACSALRRSYRDVLRDPAVLFVLLDGDRSLLLDRLTHRAGHFMPASLLDSQLALLERPGPDESAVTVPIARPLAEQVGRICTALAARPPAR